MAAVEAGEIDLVIGGAAVSEFQHGRPKAHSA